MSRIFYRLSNQNTEQGLWYDFKGNFTGLIHDKFNFCKNKDLQMPFDPELVGWLSATETLEELYVWFSKEEIKALEKYGYVVSVYSATEYKYHNNHWAIKQKSSKLVKCILPSDL